MRYLLDAYNLMYAAGFVPGSAKPGQFHAARERFLNWLADAPAIRTGTASVHLILDAKNSPTNLGQTFHRSLQLTYSFRETADDLIEKLLEREAIPSRLTVVSNDSRLRSAAWRRGCNAWSCQEFMDWMDQPPKESQPPKSSSLSEKPSDIPLSEMEELLQAFQMPKFRR